MNVMPAGRGDIEAKDIKEYSKWEKFQSIIPIIICPLMILEWMRYRMKCRIFQLRHRKCE